MFEKFKNAANQIAKESARSFIEGRYDLDARARRALDKLDLAYDSDFETIRKRYLHLSKQFHPDSGLGADQDKFIAINDAYNVLKSVHQKRKNDG